MRSVDLTARARIRDAAIAGFADQGFAKTTLRVIADRAGVSPALVVHHFGSKDGLRAACDEHLTAFIRTEKSAALASGSMPALAHYLTQNPQLRPLYDYLVRVLAEGGRAADDLFDQMVATTGAVLATGQDAGNVRDTPDPGARAAVHTAFGLGLLIFDRQVGRHLGEESLFDPPALERYAAVAIDLYTRGLLIGPAAAAARAEYLSAGGDPGAPATPNPERGPASPGTENGQE